MRPVHEAAQILALVSVLLLATSVAIWATMLRGPLLQRLDGRMASNAGAAEFASQLLVFSFALAGLAAALAFAGFIYP